MPWQKGQSGNPNGRPGRDRTLTALLQQAGGKEVQRNGVPVVRQDEAIEHIWNLAAFGRTTFRGSKKPMVIGAMTYVELVKWIYTQIDGPVPTQLQHSSDPEMPLTIRVEYDDPDPRAAIGAIGPAFTPAALLASTDDSGGA
jgi:hypothetical protein